MDSTHLKKYATLLLLFIYLSSTVQSQTLVPALHEARGKVSHLQHFDKVENYRVLLEALQTKIAAAETTDTVVKRTCQELVEEEINSIHIYYSPLSTINYDSVHAVLRYEVARSENLLSLCRADLEKLHTAEQAPVPHKRSLQVMDDLLFSYIYIDSLNGYSGGSDISLSENNTSIRQIALANIAFELKKGLYRGQYYMRGGLSYNKNNDNVTETISDAYFSYSWNITPADSYPQLVDWYADIGRYSNTFLGLDQRWEFNTGFKFNIVSSSLTPKGKKQADRLNATYELLVSDSTVTCLNQCISPLTTPNSLLREMLTEDGLTKMKEVAQEAQINTKKTYFRWRGGVKTSIVAEAETIRLLGDSIQIDEAGLDTAVLNTVTFSPRLKMRVGLRPFLDVNIGDKFTMTSEVGFVLPVIRRSHDVVEDPNYPGLDNTLTIDGIRMDARLSLALKVGKAVSIKLNVRYMNDFRPLAAFVPSIDLGDRTYVAVTPAYHYMSEVAFRYTFL